MKDKGIVRYIDKLGRLVIPIEVRREMGFAEGEPLEIIPQKGHLLLKKYEKSCFLCGNTQKEEFFVINDKKICDKCAKEIKEKFDL